MKYIACIACFIFIVLILIILNRHNEKKKIEAFKRKLKDEFNKKIGDEYSIYRLKAMRGYYLYHKNEDSIDDITWNDIDGDRLFKTINHSYSSIGDEYLYYLLRNPVLSSEATDYDTFEKQLDYFKSNEEDRLKIQVSLAKLGRSGKYSIYDYVDYLQKSKQYSNIYFIVRWVIYLLLIGLIFLYPAFGLVLLLIYSVINMFIYLGNKKDIEPYLVAVSYIVRIINTADVLNGYLKDDCFSKENEQLIRLRKRLKRINKLSMYILKPQNGGDIGNIVIDLFNILFSFDLFTFNRIRNEIVDNIDAVDGMVAVVGAIDSRISIAAFRNTVQCYCIPEFVDDTRLVIKDGVHPLIENCISNSIVTDKGILITGTNASGKSTFLRMVLISALLSQTIHTAPAREYIGNYYTVVSSMEIKDSLIDNTSYFMAEIKSIRRIIDAAGTKNKVLCVCDELLRGTNTVERISAGCEILKSLNLPNVILFTATHDYELTELLDKYYDNYHFDEDIVDNDISFNYTLKSGPSKGRNAIKLLSLMGYPEQIVNSAIELSSKLLKM